MIDPKVENKKLIYIEIWGVKKTYNIGTGRESLL